jgi:hypothetical protein
MATAETAWRRRSATLWRIYHNVGLHEVVVVVVAFLVYFFIRGLVVGRGGEAIANGYAIIDFERDFGLYWEHELQSWIIDNYYLIKALNWIYFWGHMPVIIVVAIWLYIRHRRAYVLARNAFLASGVIAVVMYWAWPVAPPRLMPFAGFIDTMAVYDKVGYNAQETKAFVNPYAAMPSLHFGWSLLLGFLFIWVVKGRLAWAAGILWPVAMFFAVVMTAIHYVVDAIAGAIVSFAGLGVALLIERYREAVFKAIEARLFGEARAPGPAG